MWLKFLNSLHVQKEVSLKIEHVGWNETVLTEKLKLWTMGMSIKGEEKPRVQAELFEIKSGGIKRNTSINIWNASIVKYTFWFCA